MTRAPATFAAVVLVLAPVVDASTASAAPHRHVVFTIDDDRITEASGLVVRDGLFTTVNDSGDSGRVFTLDRSGRTVGVTSWGSGPADAVDEEALAPWGAGTVLVGDIGDNLAERSSVSLRVVPVGRGDRTLTPTTYELSYPHGPVDAETLLVQPGTRQVLVVTKGLFGSIVYAAPRHLRAVGVNRLHRVGTALPFATDGSFFPDGRHVVVRNYSEAEVYTYPGLRQVAHLDLPSQQQGEGLALDERSQMFLSSEGEHSAVLRVVLPAALRKLVVMPRGSVAPSLKSHSPRVASAGATPDDARSLWPWLAAGGGAAAFVALAGLGLARLRRRNLR